MELRIFTEPQQGASYDQLLSVAKLAEECGYGAFFRSDHYLKMGSASGLPAYTDAWTTLAGLARDTSTVRLGTLVTPVTFRAPGVFAVQVAQVDHMSGGRVEVGLGAGWYHDEHEAYGIAFPPVGERYKVLEDQLALLQGIWSAPAGEKMELRGRTATFSLEADPLRPAQRPGPPIILGGAGGAKGSRLAATYANEYNVAFRSLDETKRIHDSVRQACDKQGRDPASMVWSAAQVLCCGSSESEVERRAKAIGREASELRANGLAGSPAEVVAKVNDFAAAGVARMYLQVLDLDDMDHIRLVAEEVMAEVA
jgi:F420-dependent oxidoreductase-like protein